MGTNYYLHTNVCQHCGRGEESKHIGKSSAGWCFSLHVIPWDGINDLADWLPLLNNPENVIRDEYGETIAPAEMVKRIAERSGKPRSGQWWRPYYQSEDEFYERNHAEPGPSNLLRHQIDGRHCVKHGEGTWDCCVGEFS